MDSDHSRACNMLVLGDSRVLRYPQDGNAIDIVYSSVLPRFSKGQGAI